MAAAWNLPRLLFGLRYGRRLPTVDGTLCLAGVGGRVLIRRNGWGVPYVLKPPLGPGIRRDAIFGKSFAQT